MPFSKKKSPSFPPVTKTAPPPTEVSPEVDLAKKDMALKLRRMRGRAASRLTIPSLMKTPELKRPALKDTLG